MIAYEELCEALERFRRRQQNQAELDHLDGGGAASETFSLRPRPGEDGFAGQPAEPTHEIDVDEMVVDER